MKRRYIENRNGTLVDLGEHCAKPRGEVYIWPENMMNEDVRWLEIYRVNGEFECLIDEIRINRDLKRKIQKEES